MIALLSLADIVRRAESAIDHGLTYKLGRGGWFPGDPLPSRDGRVDCSGFVSWLIGLARSHTIVAGMWGISTDSIHADAIGAQRTFRRIPRPIPGCFGVYPDRGGHQGHVALIIDPHTWTVIDSSLSQNGVHRHVARYWATAPGVVWCVPSWAPVEVGA